MQVAVDGPAGSGKSSVCKIVAGKCNLIYLDTGAMYRAVTYLFLMKILVTDHDAEAIDFIFSENGKRLEVIYNFKSYDVTDDIRSLEVTKHVSAVSSRKQIRQILTKKQQAIANDKDIIMEGRDITTVVLPNADVKIFLTATAEERAARRFKEIKDKTDLTYDLILQDIIRRDELDSTREAAPLKEAIDAIRVDTTSLSLEEVAGKIAEIIGRVKSCKS